MATPNVRHADGRLMTGLEPKTDISRYRGGVIVFRGYNPNKWWRDGAYTISLPAPFTAIVVSRDGLLLW